jgi:serine-type D-Ala-D-Ala carboxypeptidase (penicillin-binding protein 5/6)
MAALKGRWGRLYPLLALVVVLVVMSTVMVGVALSATATNTLVPTAETQTASFTVDAKDLGDFGTITPKIQSPSAIVINADTGKVLYEWDADVQRRMASTTKIMTAILILEKMDLSTSVTVSLKAAQTTEPEVWLKEGDVLTVEQLLYALLVRSANSAAVALAEACSGSVEAFIEEMNAKAAELGMKDTHFASPNGLDTNGHYSTARDMAVLARYAMKNETFRKMVATEEYTVSLPGRDEPTVFETTNKLLGKVDWVTGIKTGLTPRAKQCFVGSGTKDGVSVISVVLGQPSTSVCFAESRTLMEYGFAQYRHVDLLEQGAVVAEAEVPYHVNGTVQLVTETAVGMELYKNDSVTTSISLDKPLVLPVEKGDAFGRVTLTVEGEVVGTVDLVAAQSFGKTTLGTKLGYYFDRLGNWLGGLF